MSVKALKQIPKQVETPDEGKSIDLSKNNCEIITTQKTSTYVGINIEINIKYVKKELCKNIKHMCGRRHNKKKVCIYASTRLH